MTLRTLRETPARPLTVLASLLLTAGLLAGCSSADDAGDSSTAPTSTVAEDAVTDGAAESTDDAADDGATDEAAEWSYTGQDGSTALDLLLQSDPSAEVSGEGENAYVTGIDGVAADPSGEFWALYVNGEMATVGAGSLETKDGDEITWKLETF